MKKLKTIFIGIIILTALNTMIFASGSKESTDNSGGTVSQSISSIPLTVTDCFGHEVELPQKIERIACIYAFTAHVVTMLDRGEDIVSVVYGSKRDRLLNQINPYIKDAAVPSDDGVINIEEG